MDLSWLHAIINLFLNQEIAPIKPEQLICSLRRKNVKKSEEVEPEASDTTKTIIDIKCSNTNTANAATTTTVTTNPSISSIPEEDQKIIKESVPSDLEYSKQKQFNKDVLSPHSASSLSTDEQKSTQTDSIQSAQSLAGDAEMEAARMLLELGVTREEIAASDNQDSRSAVTGAYRIMLHRAHRYVSCWLIYWQCLNIDRNTLLCIALPLVLFIKKEAVMFQKRSKNSRLLPYPVRWTHNDISVLLFT